MRKTVIVLTSLAAAAGIIYFISTSFMGGVEVKTAPVKRQPLDITVTGTSTGTIRSENEIKITAQRTGRIAHLNVTEGDVVQPGSGIADLDVAETALGLEQGRATLLRARAMRDEISSSLEALRVEVSTTIKKAEASINESRTRYQGMKELFDKGYVSRIEYSMAEREYEVALAELDRAKSGSKQIVAREEQLKAQDAAIREAQSALSRADLEQGYSIIKSPADGIITSVPVKVGETVMRGALVAQMIMPGSLYIEAFIDEADVARVHLGQEVRITMDGYPGKTFQGTVSKLSPVVLGGKLETRTFEARITMKDKTVALKNGMSADVDIIVQSVPSAIIVPSQSIITRADKKYVYVKEGSKTRLREVTTGLSDWTSTQVVSGLKENEIVIITPDAKELKDGARITEAP